jgi:aminoglycoside phosphotransferase family enzyme
MTGEEIHKLLSKGKFSESAGLTELVETHISWVIVCDDFVYKIKKPIKYSFLDFSTLELRRHFCERELELNQRFSKNIYLEILPIYKHNGQYVVGGNDGTIVDYTLKMRKLDSEKQMDVLLAKNKVSGLDIKNLAEMVVQFYKKATIINEKNVFEIRKKFNDIGLDAEFLSQHLDMDVEQMIDDAIEFSNTFLNKNKSLLLTKR